MALVVLGLSAGTTGVRGAGAQVSITATPAANPALPQKCGLDLALDFDLSNSITAQQFDEMRQAAIGLASDLRGTPSAIGVYTFASFAPAFNTSPTSGTPAANAALPSVSLSTDAGATSVQNRIAGLTRVNTAFGGTNWDQGLRQVVATSQPHYDAVLFITDGNPTYYGAGSSPQGPGNATTTPVIDAAVTAANVVKAQNTKVIAVGVSDTTGPELAYLRAISGPAASSDYFVTNFAHLRQTLIGTAAEHCFGTVTVVKQVQALDGTRSPGAGWQFSANASSGATLTPTPANGVTGSDGAVNFVVDFPGAATSTTVSVSESAKPGFRPLRQGGQIALCSWNTGPPKEELVANVGAGGFSLPVASSDIVTCSVVNEVIGATLTLNKEVANIPGSGNAQPGDWRLTAQGPAPTPAAAVSGSSGIAGPVLPGTYTLSESGGPPGYTASGWVCDGTGVSQPSGSEVTLAEDAVGTCTITNTEVPVVKLVQNKSVDRLLAETGDTLAYTVSVRNVGTGAAGQFTATDALPAGVAFVGATASTGIFDHTTGEWTIPGLAVGATATLAISATVTAAPAAGETERLTNRFEVTAPPGSEPTEVQNECPDDAAQSCAETEVFGPGPSAELAQSKSVDRTVAAPGDTLTYTVEVLNTGNVAAPAFTATDTLPAGVMFVSAEPSTGSVVFNSPDVVWSIPSLAVGALATLTINLTVDTSGTEATTQTNRFGVSPPDTFPPPVVENGCADSAAQSCAETQIPGVARLTLSKSVDRATAASGDTLTYTMTVGNTGTAAAEDVLATDVLPAGVSFVSAHASQGTYDASTGVWTIGTVPADASITLTVVVTVEPVAEATTVINRFHVPAPPGGENITVENACPDNGLESCASTVVPGVPRLTQSKFVSASTAAVGDTLTYTITIDNEAGTAAADNVAATDSLPAGVSFVSASASQGSFDHSTAVWTIGSVAPGATVTLRLVVNVNAGTENSSLVNRFVLDEPNGPIAEPENPCADQPGASCATTDIPGVPRLTQSKTVDKQAAAVGDTLTYTITVSNHGTGDAVNVNAQDVLPAGVSLVSVNTNGLGTFDEPTLTWTLPLLSIGTTATLTLTVTIQPSATGQTLTNQLRVTPPPGSGATTVQDPCANDATRSCAATVVAAAAVVSTPSSQPLMANTGSPVLRLDLIALGLVSAGVILLVAARPGVRRRGRHVR